MWNQIKTVLLLGVLSTMLIGAGVLLGPAYLVGFTVLALALNLGGYFFSDRLVLALHGAREVSPTEEPLLHRLVGDLAERAGIPKPRVCVIPEAYANAFATGRNPRRGVVAVTEGLLHLLDQRELRGVLAHEIAHIKNRDILIGTIAAVLAAGVTYVATALQFSALFGSASEEEESGSPLGGLLFALLAPLGATLVQLGISRSREYVADADAAALAGDPEGLARALEKLAGSVAVNPAEASPATASLFIVSPLAGADAIVGLFSTHPQALERVRRLRGLTQTWNVGSWASARGLVPRQRVGSR